MSIKPLFFAASFATLLALTGASACDSKTGGSNAPTVAVTSDELKAGGVYVAYKVGCEKGCDQIEKGDLIQAVDGQPVSSAKDLRVSRIATGNPIKLKVHKKSGQDIEVEIVAKPNDSLPPLKEAPPFWTVGAADLDKAPDWARRTTFGHASLMCMLMSSDGGITDGRQLVGKKRLILFWDWATREEQVIATNMMKILQLAQGDLKNAGVDVMFTQIFFPGNVTGDYTEDGRPVPRQAPMNDTALRDWQTKYGQPGAPQLPMYRFPNATEYNAARELGLEGATTYFQYLRESPAIILLDEGGIIRWHSEGVQKAPASDPTFAGKDDQYTINEAITFAMKQL
ncbi:MAG: hypothetical protein JNL82_12225 [Myxococcales bacterium]|jgi:hypothetical protein|nr:hypothetical protein [Myxococcales bacterium]